MPVEELKIVPNVKQQECIENIQGPVMVLAGPGTGKTFTIIQRIKYMLNKGILPDSILCLTYSDAAANEMKARLVREIGVGASSVCVNTYHSFCNNVIRQYPNEFELLDGVSLIDEITKRDMMKASIDVYNPSAYRTKWGDAYYFIPELLKAVDEIKSNRISKDEYFNILNFHPMWQGKMQELEAEYKQREIQGKLVKTFVSNYENHKKKMSKAKEAWDIYEIYDLKMKQNNFIDFNDMINLVIDVFDYNSDFLEKVSKQYKYFLVDEYQDTNYSQNSILYKLLEGANSDNVFVVGDDDQIIYEFQGAKTDTLEKFLIKYKNTKVICLNENNRSTQNILDFSYSVISQDKTRLEFNPDFKKFNISKRLYAKNPEIIPLNKKIQIHGFADLRQENNYIVGKIQDIINSGVLPLNHDGDKNLSKIAIITRENIELSSFASLLESRNIPYQIKENKNIFDIKASLLLYCYLKSLDNPEIHSDKLFGILTSEPFKFDNSDYSFLVSQNAINHKNFIYNINNFLNTHEWADKDKVNNFIRTFNKLSSQKNIVALDEFILQAANESGILEYFLNSDINTGDNIYAIKKIADEAKSFYELHKTASLTDFLNYIDLAFESNIPILIDKDDFVQNAVQLVTLHGSKGREFDFVFIPNLVAKKWESKRVPNKVSLPIDKESNSQDEESARYSEQLRLLFVGITRAKHSLMLSYSNAIDSNPQQLTLYFAEAVKNIDLVEAYNHELDKELLIKELGLSLKKSRVSYSGILKDVIYTRGKNFILSPSSLNAYLSCPQNFLYSYILNVPSYDAKRDEANYGSAFHKALDIALKHACEAGQYQTMEEFTNSCVKNLNKQKLASEKKREELNKRIIKSASLYYRHMVDTPPSRIYSSEYVLEYVPYDKYYLKGFIDRIERNSDSTFELYDYKTGSARPKSQIADGKDYEKYLNQLRFYKFAFELKNPGATVSRLGLIYVEEPDSNFYVNLTNDDMDIIKNKIDFVYKNIEELNFEPDSSNEEACKNCNYKHICKLKSL